MDLYHRPCHTCAGIIPLAELEQRRAVVVMKRAYCGPCAERIVANGGRTTRRKFQFDTLALTGVRDHPRLFAAAAITIALAALLYLLRQLPF
jgi:hypothetical protein